MRPTIEPDTGASTARSRQVDTMVLITSRDEIGLLTRTFNSIGGIRRLSRPIPR
jgi:nitrate/nitrite-specific signal transduction histidine kinase